MRRPGPAKGTAKDGASRASSNMAFLPPEDGVVAITTHEGQVASILSVVRLGDLDHWGWWRSHGLDETGSFILSRSFKRTWAATAMELSMVSARARHDETLGRKDAVHLFSDEVPFYRLTHSWLLEQKLEDDLTPFEPFRTASKEELFDRLPGPPKVERRASGVYLGNVTRNDINDAVRLESLLSDLLGAYRTLDSEFLAPYFDLSA